MDEEIIIEEINEPKHPAIVFFGLIMLNFGPLNNLPKINPPISELIHINNVVKINILKLKLTVEIKNIKKIEDK